MPIRTDLALECVTINDVPENVNMTVRGSIFRITEIIFNDDSHRDTLGKGKGRYLTLEHSSLSRYTDDHSAMVQELADELKAFIPDGDVLVAGLGNPDITPDALGPQTAAKVLATRHLQYDMNSHDEPFLRSLRPVTAVAGGVTGQTGIETAEFIRALADEIKPSAIVAIDSLACSDLSRLGTTIQITDTGISPGSGVANARKEISAVTMGVPVIAVGVPTVVDVHTIVQSLTGRGAEADMPNMMVTPRDIDRLTERTSQLIAFGLNLALQKNMSFEDVRGIF